MHGYGKVFERTPEKANDQNLYNEEHAETTNNVWGNTIRIQIRIKCSIIK